MTFTFEELYAVFGSWWVLSLFFMTVLIVIVYIFFIKMDKTR